MKVLTIPEALPRRDHLTGYTTLIRIKILDIWDIWT